MNIPPLALGRGKEDEVDILARPHVSCKFKPEEQITVNLADTLRLYSRTGALKAVWHHPANEAKVPVYVGAKRKAMGLIPGTADFVFSWANGSGYIELKTAKGVANPNQKAFRKWCEKNGVKYEICKSDVDALNILREWGVLS